MIGIGRWMGVHGAEGVWIQPGLLAEEAGMLGHCLTEDAWLPRGTKEVPFVLRALNSRTCGRQSTAGRMKMAHERGGARGPGGPGLGRAGLGAVDGDRRLAQKTP